MTRTRVDPAVSVVVPSYRGEGHITRCLHSLAAQTLPLEDFEIVVVLNGPPDATPDRIAAVRTEFPGLQLRAVRIDEAGAGLARNAGIALARGHYTTFVDDDDRVSPGFLEGLLKLAEAAPSDRLVVVAPVADVGEDDVPDFDNYINRRLLRLAGETVPTETVPSAVGFVAAKLAATAWLRGCRFETGLRSGEDLVFWFDVFNRAPFAIRVCDPVEDVVYYRHLRDASVSRRAPSYSFNVEERLETIAALAAREPTSDAAATLRQRLLAAQTGHVNRYLKENPDDHPKVVRDIRDRGLEPVVPSKPLNAGLARDLAILYAFLPSADTSALVSARRIRKREVVVDVISNHMPSVRDVDPAAYRIAHEFLGDHHQLRNRTSAWVWRRIEEFVEDGWAKIAQWEAEKGKYRSVYSRSMWPASHFLAAVYKIRHPSIPWIAEFSDPQLWDSKGQRRTEPANRGPLLNELRRAVTAAGFKLPEPLSAPALVEVLAYALADEIVFTNENQREFMLGYVDDAKLAARAHERSTVSHHPTMPPEFYHLSHATYDAISPDVVNVAYFGVFYTTRGLTEVVEAIGALDPDVRDRLRLHVFTPKPDELDAEIQGTPLEGVVRTNAFRPYLDFLNLTTQMDVLLVNDARTKPHFPLNPYLPSKWSDYSGSGSDVWCLYEPGSVLSSMDSRYRSEIGDVEGAKKELTRMVEDLRVSGRRAPENA